MKKLKRSLSTASGRLTLYVKPEHQELIEWVQHHTQAPSLSEAVFSALSELKALMKERQLQALEQTHGLRSRLGEPQTLLALLKRFNQLF